MLPVRQLASPRVRQRALRPAWQQAQQRAWWRPAPRPRGRGLVARLRLRDHGLDGSCLNRLGLDGLLDCRSGFGLSGFGGRGGLRLSGRLSRFGGSLGLDSLGAIVLVASVIQLFVAADQAVFVLAAAARRLRRRRRLRSGSAEPSAPSIGATPSSVCSMASVCSWGRPRERLQRRERRAWRRAARWPRSGPAPRPCFPVRSSARRIGLPRGGCGHGRGGDCGRRRRHRQRPRQPARGGCWPARPGRDRRVLRYGPGVRRVPAVRRVPDARRARLRRGGCHVLAAASALSALSPRASLRRLRLRSEPWRSPRRSWPSWRPLPRPEAPRLAVSSWAAGAAAGGAVAIAGQPADQALNRPPSRRRRAGAGAAAAAPGPAWTRARVARA